LVKIKDLVAEISFNQVFKIKEALLEDNRNLVEVFKIIKEVLDSQIINLEVKTILIKDQTITN
jgi:hypothetical protein